MAEKEVYDLLSNVDKKEEIFQTLSKVTNVNWTHPTAEYTLLHRACAYNNVEAVKFLLAHPDINPNLRANQFFTPIRMTCCNYANEALIELVKHPHTDVKSELAYICRLDAPWLLHILLASARYFDGPTIKHAKEPGCSQTNLVTLEGYEKDPFQFTRTLRKRLNLEGKLFLYL